MPTTTVFPAVFNLGNLNGLNGFKMDGEARDDSGLSVSAAGDVNGDGYGDVLIGAPVYTTSTSVNIGRSYLVFGGNQTVPGGVLALSSLNGLTGYKLDGEAADDDSSYQVSAAGDINGDGYEDVLVGAPNHARTVNGSIGRSYVVFGSKEIVTSGILALSSLNGSNGFKIDGENFSSAVGENSGHSVAAAGDVNGDHLGDLLIGAYGHNNFIGRSYVIFGDVAPTLWANQLTIGKGQTKILTAQNLNATDNAPVQFNITRLAQGHFELMTNLGQPITLFSQSQVLTGQVQFVHDGSDIAPSYFVQTPNAGIALTPASQAANITFYPLTLLKNYLLVHQGESVLLTTDLLNVTDIYPPNEVVITISALQHGQFHLMPLNNSITQFTQQQLVTGQIFFTHDNSGAAPSYQVIASDSRITLSSQAANVTFYRKPTLTSQAFSLHQGESISITPSVLSIIEDYPLLQVNITIGGLQHGQFVLAPLNNTVMEFSAAQLQASQIFFIQDGSSGFPSYQVGLSDPYFTLPAQASNITFYRQLVLINNQLVINQAQNLRVTSSLLNVSDDYLSSQVNITVSNLQHGQFMLTPLNNSVTQFTSIQLQTGQVWFAQDGSASAPSYAVGVSDPYFTLPPAPAAVTFYRRPALTSAFSIHQGELLPMNASFVMSEDYPAGQVTLTVSTVQHGQFELAPGNTVVTQFSQQQLQFGLISFQQDNSNFAPNFTVSLSDPYFTLSPITPAVTFYRRPVLVNNQLSIRQGDSLVMTTTQLDVINDDYPSNQVLLTITNLANGEFLLLPTNNSVTQFTQQQLTSGQVIFAQEGYPNSPVYDVTVSDPYFNLSASSAAVVFTPMPPVLVRNSLSALQNRSTVLTSANLLATDPDPTLSSTQLVFNVSNVQHGQFSLVSAPTTAITQFTQDQVNNGQVQFVDNGDPTTPAYAISISDGRLSTAPQSAIISFDLAPVFNTNQLNIARSQTLRLDQTDIAATDDHATPAQLAFTVDSIIHGHFSLAAQSGSVISNFSQGDINSGAVEFTHDGSDQAPAYALTVMDNVGLTAGPLNANVTYDINPITVVTANSDTVRNAIIGGVISGIFGLGFFAMRIWLNRKAEQYFDKATQKDGTLKQQAEFKQNILQPIARQVLDSVNVKGFMGYVNDRTMKEAVTVIAGLVHELQSQGVNVDLTTMSAIEQNRLLTAIARQARKILVPEASCCSATQFARFFYPETTPRQMEDKTTEIASAVKDVLAKRSVTSSGSPISPSADVELTTVSGPTETPAATEVQTYSM